MNAQELRTELAITGWGLRCATGDQIFALLGAVGTGMSLARPDVVHEGLKPDGTGTAPVLTCPVLEVAEGPVERLLELCGRALAGLSFVDEAPDRSGRVRLLVQGPPADSERGQLAAEQDWLGSLSAWLSSELAVDWTVEQVPSALDGLLMAADLIGGGACERVVLGGVDSLLDPLTVAELAQARKLLVHGAGDGLVPGEAAAFVVLESAAAGARSLGRLRAVARRSEPAHGRPDETRLEGLASAMETVAEITQASPDCIECVVVPLAGHRHRMLEWHQATTRLWPLRLAETERQAMERGEVEAPQPVPEPEREILDPGITLGETGAAGLWLSLLLACARFDFDWPAREAVVVAHMPDAPERGAIWMEAAKGDEMVNGGG